MDAHPGDAHRPAEPSAEIAQASAGQAGAAGEGSSAGGLRRNLKARHVNLIAIGGAIGTGLFVGTGASISGAGPGGAVVSYGVIGIAIYFMMMEEATSSTAMVMAHEYQYIHPTAKPSAGSTYSPV